MLRKYLLIFFLIFSENFDEMTMFEEPLSKSVAVMTFAIYDRGLLALKMSLHILNFINFNVEFSVQYSVPKTQVLNGTLNLKMKIPKLWTTYTNMPFIWENKKNNL